MDGRLRGTEGGVWGIGTDSVKRFTGYTAWNFMVLWLLLTMLSVRSDITTLLLLSILTFDFNLVDVYRSAIASKISTSATREHSLTLLARTYLPRQDIHK